jgi:hypothetical protein
MTDETTTNDAQGDLENVLVAISGVADVLHAMGLHDNGIAYLSNQLTEHYRDAQDAFCRIYKLNQYRERAAQ